MTHRVFDIKARVDLFTGIEDIVWVKNVFGRFKEFKHLFTEHLVQKRCAHNSIIVFTTDVALVFDGGVVEFLGHSGN